MVSPRSFLREMITKSRHARIEPLELEVFYGAERTRERLPKHTSETEMASAAHGNRFMPLSRESPFGLSEYRLVLTNDTLDALRRLSRQWIQNSGKESVFRVQDLRYNWELTTALVRTGLWIPSGNPACFAF